MNHQAPIPTSGYRIKKIFAVRQQQELVDVSSSQEANETRNVSFAWDWRILDPAFEVWLGVSVGPSKVHGEQLSYHVVGTFECSDETPAVSLQDFVVQNAIATLLPFIREGLAQLSSRGPFDTYYLPPINATKLARQFDYAGSTGSKQFELFPEFRSKILPIETIETNAPVKGA